MKRPVLDIRGLVVHRDGTLIIDRLDRLDWRVERGQHLVILGANGSGKTSLPSVLTGQAFAHHSKLTIAAPSFPGIFRP